MQQSEKGGVIVLAEGETLDPKSRGPDDESVLADWRTKAFELATEIETMSTDQKALEKRLELSEELRIAAESKLSNFAVLTVISWLITAAVLFNAFRG